MLEKVMGRNHFWHYHPEIVEHADTFMVKVVMPKGGIHNFHRHPEMNEILYILKGTVEQWIEDEMQLLQAGDSVYIDPNVVHATINAGDDDLEPDRDSLWRIAADSTFTRDCVEPRGGDCDGSWLWAGPSLDG